MLEYAQDPLEARLVVGHDPSSGRRGFATGYGQVSPTLVAGGRTLRALYYEPDQGGGGGQLQVVPAELGLAHLELGAQKLLPQADGRWTLTKDPFPADGAAIWLRSGRWHSERQPTDTAFRVRPSPGEVASQRLAPSMAFSLERFDPVVFEQASRSLLPPQTTAGERLLESQFARMAAPYMKLDRLWDPRSCPTKLLPWLGWALHVDVWDPTWPVARKRQAILQSLALHRKKGTRSAVSQSLILLGGVHRITEWFEPEADALWPSDLRLSGQPAPYTFLVETLTDDINLIDWQRVIDANKPARCHYRVNQSRQCQVNIEILIGVIPFQHVSTTISHTFS